MRTLLLFSLFIVCINGLWSNKCKHAETTDDKVVKFIQSANCTIIESSKKIKEKFKSAGRHIQGQFENLQERLGLKKKQQSEDVGLDYDIDVRSLKEGYVIETTSERMRRSTDEEENLGEGKFM
jgi:hypothetical protein